MPDAFTDAQRQLVEEFIEAWRGRAGLRIAHALHHLLAAHDALVAQLAQVTAERDALAHGDSLVCAAAARGVTDCSTPAHIRVQNIVTELERAEARIAHLEAERDAPATPDEPPVTRCDGCGYQWPGPWPPAHLCGDCWRKAQPVLHAPAPVEPSWAQRFAAMSHNDRLMTIAEDGSTLVALIQEALHGPAGGALGGQTVPSESTGILIGDVVMFGGRMEPPRFQQVTTDYESRRWAERLSEVTAILRPVWRRATKRAELEAEHIPREDRARAIEAAGIYGDFIEARRLLRLEDTP